MPLSRFIVARTIGPCIKMCPSVYAVGRSGLCAALVFFLPDNLSRAGMKEMFVCKVLSQGIPGSEQTKTQTSMRAAGTKEKPK